MEITLTIKTKESEDHQKPRSRYRAIAGKLLRGIAKVRVQPEWPEYTALVEAYGIEVASG